MKLFIDTTQNFCNLALINNKNQILDTYQELTNNNMTDIVVEKINYILCKNKIDKSKIDSIYLLIGPGCFTGCRVGYIIAITWANINNIKLYIMNSLLFQTNKGTGVSVIDAKSNKKFIAIYNKYKSLVEPKIVSCKEAEILCKKYKKYYVYIDYKNVDFFEKLKQHLSKFNYVKNIFKLEPLYLKKPVE